MSASCLSGNVLLRNTSSSAANWPECCHSAVFPKCFKNTYSILEYCHKLTKDQQNQEHFVLTEENRALSLFWE